MKLLSGRFLQIAAIIWTALCLSLLVHTLLLRNATPHDFGDAEELEELAMLVLAFPSSLVGLLPFRGITLPYLENDPRAIFLGWLFLFVVGYIQWFLFVPFMARWFGRKFRGRPVR